MDRSCILLATSHTARWLARYRKGRLTGRGESGGGPISGEAQWFVDLFSGSLPIWAGRSTPTTEEEYFRMRCGH